MCPLLHRCVWWSASSADVHAYSAEPMPIMPTQGRMTIQVRLRPMMSMSDSPTRYARPFRSVTSRYGTDVG
ncbi:hypothetical protein SHL15_6402 [Streptomyces hygroscopicus subsp. limoneus]|nr:hypothetical protein SHL15_6402 [Streptomyces hygroscopicus subsp. limoneus]